MSNLTARFVVGIDLGTTHTVVAYAEIDPKKKGAPEPRIFEVTQLTTVREREALAMLPSCLYAPIPGEIEGDPDWVAGEIARKRGAEVVGRFVSSAKSWLSHGAVDRLAAILPWGAPDAPGENGEAGTPARRISPVDASARILAHLREAWDRDLPDAPLAEQDVVLTLPASFDEVARELTLRAAEQAGLHPVLLEEPSAAFYAAMRGERAIREIAADGGERTVLVCDVGGGTTDLSLMGITKASAAPWFAVRRIAVGRHILLGGDNMDLALAHVAESRLAKGGGRLETAELAQLVLSCREAKERILGAAAADEARVTVLGRGSKLVGGARSTTIKREEVERVVLEGFFPPVLDDVPEKRRAGIVSFGLPYERDPAITRHVRQFLARHASEMPRGAPDALLLNGGVFNAKPIVQALTDAIAGFGGEPPSIIPGTDPDLAVARGAVLFGFARRGVGVRIESGASHGYYVALAPEHEGGEVRAVCILPRGAKEGVRHEAGRRFELVVGRNVRFDLFASDVARDEAGALVAIAEDAFERLPPVVARLPASGKEQTVPVHLGGELLTTGQLELACTEGRAAPAGLAIEDAEAVALALAGTGSRTKKLEALCAALATCSPVEARYLARAVLGEMRVGAKEGIVEDAIAKAFGRTLPEVRRAAGLVTDVGELARLAAEDRLAEACVVIGRPLGFMLATPIETARGADLTVPHVMEDKIDGIRAQAHVSADGVRLFARGKGPVTAAFPDVARPLAEAARSGTLTPAILDGEIVVFGADGRPRPFSAIQPRLKKTEPDEALVADHPVRYLVYDLLYEGTESTLALPFLERRARLARWAAQAPAPLVLHDSRPLLGPEAVDAEFDAARARGFEGLVLKRLDAPYAAGVRGFAWLKVKKALATLDVVVIAAERGHGRRAGVLSDYTFAVRSGDELLTVGKAYSGLTDEEIRGMTTRLEALAVGEEKRGYLVVRPEIVIEVAFDGLQRSERHSSGFALRFPRIAHIRDDKKPEEADTIDVVRGLWEAQLASGHREDLTAKDKKPEKKKGRRSGRRPDIRAKSKQLKLFDD